jgi:hypothetical protein
MSACKNGFSIGLALTILLFASGCCTTHPSDPVAFFRRTNPTEAKQYVYLHEVNLDAYSMLIGERLASLNGVVMGMKQRFGEIPGVNEYADKIMRQQAEEKEHVLQYFEELRQASAGGGAICQYEWNGGKTRETGLLVVKSGRVVRREPWLTEYLSNLDARVEENTTVPGAK